MFSAGEYSDAAFEGMSSLPCTKKKKKNKLVNKRRFSDEQIRSLESIFKSESRLEPRKKLQLARELGLQPRQVAIWFQNKRARWKSKQLERDFSILRANYNALSSRFESLKKEKQSLITQVDTPPISLSSFNSIKQSRRQLRVLIEAANHMCMDALLIG